MYKVIVNRIKAID